ncbi:MAG: carboxypeptidase-like regulatory domain-containing protein, partial [Bacteroidota bacterium]
MYIAGEKVFFSAIIFNVKDLFAEELSRTFYCELITPDGNRITGGKYLLQNAAGQGCLTIPEETISGIYFLKFYTRFMRNTGTDKYTYIMLKIINPFKTEVLSGKDTFDRTDLAGTNMDVLAGDQSLHILSGKKRFSPREEIRLTIKLNTGKEMPARLCLSVIPESTYGDQFFPDKHEVNAANNGVYLPETRGISLSGQLIGKESGKPFPDANVYLSIIGDKDILVVRTDSSGRFFFALPDYTGNRDIFLCADDLPDITPEILIDNDFCSRPVNLPSPPFTLNEEEMKAAYKLAVNFRVTSKFREDILVSDFPEKENTTSFYGEPSDVFVMEKYIDLPTLEEYFSELPVMLKLRKVQGRKRFMFYTTQVEMSFHDPLVLVDWVAV